MNPQAGHRHTACMRYISASHRSQSILSTFVELGLTLSGLEWSTLRGAEGSAAAGAAVSSGNVGCAGGRGGASSDIARIISHDGEGNAGLGGGKKGGPSMSKRRSERVVGTIGRHVRELARVTGLSAWRGFVSFYRSDNLTYAASIAYYALLSLFPFSMLAIAILGSVTADQADRNAVLGFVLRYFPKQFGFITTQLDAFRANTVTFGIAGSIALIWGSLGIFGAISTAVNYAWGVEKTRSFWKHRLFSFLMLLVAGLVLIVALLLVSASQVVGASWFAGVLARFPGLAVLRGFAVRHATTFLFIVVVGLVYYFVPNTKVRFRDVWIGALVTGLLWKGALEGFSWFMRDMTRFTRVNGSIAAVVVFLIWVYTQAVILLYGAQFTAAYARLRRGRAEERLAAPTPTRSETGPRLSSTR